MNAGCWAVVVIGGTLALGHWARLHPRPPTPALRDPTTAAAWMVDALPGVGPKRLDPALAALRAGRFDDLPKPARAAARELFTSAAATAAER